MRVFLWAMLALLVVDVLGHAYYAGRGERVKSAANSWLDCFCALGFAVWAAYLLAVS